MASEAEVATPGTVERGGVSAIVARGRDGVVRAFDNVCRHRGSRLLEEPCGSLVRIQCPYHARVYDLDGRLTRAKHTEGLEDFDRADFGLTPLEVQLADGVVCLRIAEDALRPNRSARSPTKRSPR